MEKQIGIAVKEIKAIDFKDRTVVVAKTGEKVKILDVFKDTNTVWIQCQGWEFEVCTSLDNIQLQGEMKMKWIPKKYMEHLDEVYKDSDGWWAYSSKGYKFTDTDCHTVHEDTQNEILPKIRTLVPCDCDQCTAPDVVEEQASASEPVEVEDTEIADFKRYTELLTKVYSTKTTATAEEQQELDALGYKLELNGVPDIISEMNFSRLESKLEKYEKESADEKINVTWWDYSKDQLFTEEITQEQIEWLQKQPHIDVDCIDNMIQIGLEIRIRDTKTNHIESWYCQKFHSLEDYNQEVNRQFELKDYYKQTHLFEIEHIDLKHFKKGMQ